MLIYSKIKTKMTIPSEIQALIDRLNQELAEIEQEATEGLNLARPILTRFPDSAFLIQLFASVNNSLLFVETYTRVIQNIVEEISGENVPIQVVQETGEDLATLLGRVLEVKINAIRIKTRLSNWL